MIPITAIFIVGYGLIKKQKVYEQFIDGAKDGLGTVLSIIPTLIGLMIGGYKRIRSVIVDCQGHRKIYYTYRSTGGCDSDYYSKIFLIKCSKYIMPGFI